MYLIPVQEIGVTSAPAGDLKHIVGHECRPVQRVKAGKEPGIAEGKEWRL